MKNSSNLVSCSTIRLFLWLAVGVVAATSANAQQPASSVSEDRDRGIQLYKQGDTKGAIEVLRATLNRDKEDGDAWHYLGLALLGVADKNEARKAFERAAKLRIDNLSNFNYTGPPKTDEERKARWQATLARLDSALESVEHYMALTPKPSSEWRTRLDNLHKDKEYYENAPNTGIFSAKDVTTKARIVSKPGPTYTEEARNHNVVGTVVLRA